VTSANDYLIAAWRRAAPGAAVERGFPRGFWPDLARAAVEMALAGDTSTPLSFRPTTCSRGDWPEPNHTVVKGIDVSKLEFKL